MPGDVGPIDSTRTRSESISSETPEPLPQIWDASTVPEEGHEAFQLHMHGYANGNSKKGSTFQAKGENCGSWDSPPNPQCHASFGDQGTTATVSAYGHLMQFSDYLGVGKSGMFAVDHESTSQPYQVMLRSAELESMSTSSHVGDYGLDFPSIRLNSAPRLTWVHWRWPRFEYDLEYTKIPSAEDTSSETASERSRTLEEKEKVKLTIQWVVNNKTVLQQCRVENLGENSIDVPFSFKTNMFIRDLDYLSGAYLFNTTEQEMRWNFNTDMGSESRKIKAFGMAGPNGYGWACTRKLPETSLQEEEAGLTAQNRIPRSEADKIIKNLAGRASKDLQLRSAMTRLTNGQATTAEYERVSNAISAIPGRNREPKDEHSSEKDAKKTPLPSLQPDEPGALATVVSVFLDGVLLKHSEMESTTRSLPGKKTRQNNESSSMEVVTAYKLLHLPESKADWRNFLIPSSAANVNDILQEMSFCHLSLSKIQLPNNDEKELAEDGTDTLDSEAEKPPGRASREDNEDSQPRLLGFEPPFKTPSKSVASLTSHIDFIVWRNLENILSTCAIPVTCPALQEESDCQPEPTERPVALTCGDIAGHRICTSASFFAFQFLLNISQRLKSLDSSPTQSYHAYVQYLQDRIDRTCKGHMIWLAKLSEKEESGYFAANYKVTGKIMHEDSWSWRPNNAPTDTPFQLIKAMDFLKVYPREISMAVEVLDPVWPKWVVALQRQDVRAKTVWPHAVEEDTNTFRLDDHVWIWKALKSLESLKGTEMWKDFPSGLITGSEVQLPELVKRFSSAEVQREALRRFTTENEVSRKRMLAVTRSPRDNRFLLHARDTALFYGLDWKFFLMDTSFYEVWENTIKAQAHHEDNNEASWDNALRYALVIIMGTRGYSINKSTPEDLVLLAVEVLFQSTSPNGFFPGQLDKDTKEPGNFYDEADRDFYFHASFEIPYILLTNADRVNELYKRASKALHGSKSSQPPLQRSETSQMYLERKIEELRIRIDQLTRDPRASISEITERLTAQPKHQQMASDTLGGDPQHASLHQLSLTLDKLEASRGVGRPLVLAMKKIVPFNNLIDSSNIVNVEEEWIYNYPPFLLHDREIPIVEAIKAYVSLQVLEGSYIGGVVGDELKKYSGTPLLDFKHTSQKSENTSAFLIDTPKSKQFGRQQKRELSDNGSAFPLTNEMLWTRLMLPRTAKGAKKRFIWLPRANRETALLCFLASSESEKPYISAFFDRHSKYEKYFFDDTTMVLNTWETEFHLSFYVIVPAISGETVPRQGIPIPSIDSFPRSEKRIFRASMGFRFDGDFFDRYWTCHFIQFDPSGRTGEFWDLARFPLYSENRAWRQRKILELHLFEITLTGVFISAQEIFEEVRTSLGVRAGAFFSIGFVLNSEDYFSSSKEWQQFQQILQAIDEDLSVVLVTVSKWMARETSRGQERPRWTRRDERKYRGSINKLLSSTDRRITDLRSLQANIRALKETLASSQDKIRDDLNLRGSENIRFFTYVTVVFLPLGFAASIFSMGGAPDQTLLVSMVICAIVTFAITVIALLNAKTLASIYETASLVVDEYSRATMRVSSMVHSHKRKKEKRMHQHNDDVKPSMRKIGHSEQVRRRKTAAESEVSWHLLFWLAFILMELPARFVLRAYHALKDGRLTQEAALDVFAGFFSMPLFMLSWLLQLVLYNLVDLIILFGSSIGWFFSPPSAKMDGQDAQRLNCLTYPPAVSRPIKILWTKWEVASPEKTIAATAELEKKANNGSQEV